MGEKERQTMTDKQDKKATGNQTTLREYAPKLGEVVMWVQSLQFPGKSKREVVVPLEIVNIQADGCTGTNPNGPGSHLDRHWLTWDAPVRPRKGQPCP